MKSEICFFQSISLGNRALDLVISFNAAIDPNTGPTLDQLNERIKLAECVRKYFMAVNLRSYSLILDLCKEMESWSTFSIKDLSEVCKKIDVQYAKLSTMEFSFEDLTQKASVEDGFKRARVFDEKSLRRITNAPTDWSEEKEAQTSTTQDSKHLTGHLDSSNGTELWSLPTCKPSSDFPVSVSDRSLISYEVSSPQKCDAPLIQLRSAEAIRYETLPQLSNPPHHSSLRLRASSLPSKFLSPTSREDLVSRKCGGDT